jgi:hypothetical protein
VTAHDDHITMDRSAYLERLAGAVAWGLSGERPAWSRTVARIDASQGSYRREDLELVRAAALQQVTDGLATWFGPIYEAREPGTGIPDLEQPPEDIWRGLICLNQGIFIPAEGSEPPLLPLLVTLASTVPGEGPLYMSLNLDGWGIQPPGTGG